MTDGVSTPETPKPRPFLHHARTVAGVTALSRVSGLVRDAICSKAIGATAEWSSFSTAFLLPNLFRRLFGEGALAAAFVPIYARLVEEDPNRANAFASSVAGAMLAVLGLVVLALEALGAFLLLGGVVGEAGRLTLQLAMIMLPFMPLVCTTAMLGGVLHTHGRFGPPAAAPIVLNVCMFSAALLGWLVLGWGPATLAIAMACAVVLAGVLQVVWHIAALRETVRWTRDWQGSRGDIAALVRRMAPVIVGMGALQLGTLIDGLLAGYPVLVGPDLPAIGGGEPTAYPLDEASGSVLYYGARLYQFPLGVFGIAIATAVFPALARTRARSGEFAEMLRRGLRTSFFVGLPATVGLVIVAEDLVAVVYEGGAFDSEASRRVATALRWYALAVWSASITHVMTRAFYAAGDTKTPMRTGIAAVALNIVLSAALMWTPLREAGLALATGVSASAQALVLIAVARGRLTSDGPAVRRSEAGGMARTVIAGLVMGGAVGGAAVLLPTGAGWGGHALRLAVCVGVGAVVFGGLARLLRMPELGWLFERGTR